MGKQEERLTRDYFEKLARDGGMDADQTEARTVGLARGIRLAMDADPGDPAIEDIVDEYVSFIADPGTEIDVKRALAFCCEPLYRYMFTAADSIKGGDRAQRIYQMILSELVGRLEDLG